MPNPDDAPEYTPDTPKPADDTEAEEVDPTPGDDETEGADDPEPDTAFASEDIDVPEVTRKLDAISHELSILHKAITQMMTSVAPAPVADEATDTTRPDNVHDGVKTIDELDL